MVLSANDPLELFSNSIQATFTPLESTFRKFAKNFEHCFNGVVWNGDVHIAADCNDVEQAAQLNVKNSSRHVVINGDDQKKGKVPIKIFRGIFTEKCGRNDFNLRRDWDGKGNANLSKKERCGSDDVVDGNGKLNDFRPRFELALCFLVNGFAQAVLSSFRAEKMGLLKIMNKDSSRCGDSHVRGEVEGRVVGGIETKELNTKERKDLPFENLMRFVFDQLSNFPTFGVVDQDHDCKDRDHEALAPPVDQFDHFKALTSVLEGKRAGMNGFFGNLQFARMGGLPSNLLGVHSMKDVGEECDSNNVNEEESGSNSTEKLKSELLSIPLSKVERLSSRFSTVSLTELAELLPQIGGPSKEDHPDKKKLSSVQDFFRYTEAEGKRLFQELDRDGDGKVTLEDLEIAMNKRNLPKKYAQEFMQRTRRLLFSKSFGWKEFLSLMEQKEPTFLRAYTSLSSSKTGALQKNEILASFENAGIPANEDNAVAMMHFLNSDKEESISYGHFRNFMLLLPSNQLQEDLRSIGSKNAIVTVSPPVEISTDSVLKSALAGGISCSFSTFLMHPIDTVKNDADGFTELAKLNSFLATKLIWQQSRMSPYDSRSPTEKRPTNFWVFYDGVSPVWLVHAFAPSEIPFPDGADFVLFYDGHLNPLFKLVGQTQVQASSTLSFTKILAKLPQLGLRGLYMGSIPAIVGQFSSHGLRTGICEASKVVLIHVAPSLPEIQVESMASFLGTFLGTTMRIPCEVLKQRLQAGQFNHVGEALVGTWQQDGLRGFFRGTGMTLCRELPFYVAGSALYAESKKAVQKLLGRELEPWETVAVGAISGGLTAVLTTPFDVIKTRMMTALQGQPTTMSIVALSILRHEGPLGLFRGAVPRFFWVAPLGAINFAGYELIRKAMD